MGCRKCLFSELIIVLHYMLLLGTHFNILRPKRNGRHFPDDNFKWIFLNEYVWISIKISPKFAPKNAIENIPASVQIVAWHRQPGDKTLSEPMMVSLLTHTCVTRPQWVKLTSYAAAHIMPSLTDTCNSLKWKIVITLSTFSFLVAQKLSFWQLLVYAMAASSSTRRHFHFGDTGHGYYCGPTYWEELGEFEKIGRYELEFKTTANIPRYRLNSINVYEAIL